MKNNRMIDTEMRDSYLLHVMRVIGRNCPTTSFENNVTKAAQGHQAMMAISNDMPESGGAESVGVTGGPEVAASDDDDGGDSDGEPARRSPLKHPSPSGKHRNATATAGALFISKNSDKALWQLPTVLAHVPISRPGWRHDVKAGEYPAPVNRSRRCNACRASDIRSLIASF